MHSSGPELTGTPERLLDLCPGVLFRQRADFSFEYIGPQIEPWSGFSAEEWLRRGDLLSQLVHESDATSLREHLAQCSRTPGEARLTFRIRNRRTGRITSLAESRRAVHDAAGNLSGFEGIWIDVSMQALAARQLDAAAWHATFGLATLGAVHDLNNKLTAILSLSDLYLVEIDKAHPLRDGLAMIKQSAQQASQLLHQLSALHQGSAGQKEYVDVNQFVTVTIDLLRRVMPNRVAIESVLHNEPLAVPIDRIRLQRLVASWAIHACARMPKRGALKLQTHRVQRHGKQFAALTITDKGREVIVPDGGKEPFVVRETPEAGTIDQLVEFARQHGGALEFESEPSGTTINLLLAEASFTESQSQVTRPWVLLLGMVPGELAELAQKLESRGLMPVIAAEIVDGQLNTNWFSWSAIVIQGTVAAAAQLLEPVRKHRLPVKVVVCLAGGDISELEPWVASAAELVTPADWSRERVAERIAKLFK